MNLTKRKAIVLVIVGLSFILGYPTLFYIMNLMFLFPDAIFSGNFTRFQFAVIFRFPLIIICFINGVTLAKAFQGKQAYKVALLTGVIESIYLVVIRAEISYESFGSVGYILAQVRHVIAPIFVILGFLTTQIKKI